MVVIFDWEGTLEMDDIAVTLDSRSQSSPSKPPQEHEPIHADTDPIIGTN